MSVRVLFFAHLQDVTGCREAALDLAEGATVEAAAVWLCEHYPGLDLPGAARAAVNAEFADLHTVLHSGDELAWMPPMSGG